MHLPCRYLFEYRAIGVFRVEHRYVPERYVGNRKVKPFQERLFYLLEAFRAYFLLRVQVSEHLARQQVFLEGHHVRLRVADGSSTSFGRTFLSWSTSTMVSVMACGV